MRTHFLRVLLAFIVGVGVVSLYRLNNVAAQSGEELSEEELLEQGRYIAQIAGCITCHTPYQEKYEVAFGTNDFSALTPEEIQAMALREHNALDIENRILAGGRPFDLGPMGVVLTSNITPDEATGIGDWSDEELEVAIRTGLRPDGTQMLPLMPYRLYVNMADSDMEALITYLRSIEAVENEVPPSGIFMPPMGFEMPADEILAPDPEDAEARGAYLINAIVPCTDCHTPLDPDTGVQNPELHLAGGQPFEGPWGIIYGANITSHPETGIGEWSDDDIFRVLSAGVRRDGRRLILMPWQDYAVLSDPDRLAILNYLRSLEPLDNEVPAPSIEPLFVETVELTGEDN